MTDMDGDARDGGAFASLATLLKRRADWRHLTALSPSRKPVLVAPVSGFGIECDRQLVRDALRSGRLQAYLLHPARPYHIDADFWDQDWAWKATIDGAPLLAKLDDGSMHRFFPHAKWDDFTAIFPAERNPAEAPSASVTAAAEARQLVALQRQGYLPPYLAFMVWVSRQLNLTDKNIVKAELKNWLAANWPSELFQPSDRKIRTMATFLGKPDSEKGGRQKDATKLEPQLVAPRPVLTEIRVTEGERLPPYLSFMIAVMEPRFSQGRFPKKVLRAKLGADWSSELGPYTAQKIEAMAMLLGDPAYETGGLLPADAIRSLVQRFNR